MSRMGKSFESGGEEYLTCEEVVTFLLDYVARELPPDQEREFERHLSICPSCVAYLRTYREAVRMGREATRLEAGSAPAQLSAELVRAILASRHG